ncbi:acyl-CoA carboxylase subunit epsilon [Streptomyces sp. NRRL S-646]|uniref:acyl-CoA carboxylase subunit epsilon n=1 Tax=Streptomyces sp. NRRL S-646 TaxID=1463917 RepID=UPI0004C6A0AA|nr:acyl-CoA carboxylase subunit epsilon [Streptomyces sp. NRRL S-646]
MAGPTAKSPLIRIESGNPGEEELVALTAVLLARTGEPPDVDADDLPAVQWQRPERRTPYQSPISWQR